MNSVIEPGLLLIVEDQRLLVINLFTIRTYGRVGDLVYLPKVRNMTESNTIQQSRFVLLVYRKGRVVLALCGLLPVVDLQVVQIRFVYKKFHCLLHGESSLMPVRAARLLSENWFVALVLQCGSQIFQVYSCKADIVVAPSCMKTFNDDFIALVSCCWSYLNNWVRSVNYCTPSRKTTSKIKSGIRLASAWFLETTMENLLKQESVTKET